MAITIKRSKDQSAKTIKAKPPTQVKKVEAPGDQSATPEPEKDIKLDKKAQAKKDKQDKKDKKGKKGKKDKETPADILADIPDDGEKKGVHPALAAYFALASFVMFSVLIFLQYWEWKGYQDHPSVWPVDPTMMLSPAATASTDDEFVDEKGMGDEEGDEFADEEGVDGESKGDESKSESDADKEAEPEAEPEADDDDDFVL